jgi:hypothetical protein
MALVDKNSVLLRIIKERAFPGMTHPDEETLEQYVLGQLDEPSLAEIEEHLLLCARCRERLEAAEEYVSILRQAVKDVEVPSQNASWISSIFDSFRMNWIRTAGPALALACALLIGITLWRPWPAAGPTSWTTVHLEALRSSDPAGTVPSGSAIHFRLDTAGLPPGQVRAQVTDADRRVVCQNNVAIGNGPALLDCSNAFAAGTYWVRLRACEQLIREYGLTVRER